MIDVENIRAQIARAPHAEVQGILARVYAAYAAGEIDEGAVAALDAAVRDRQQGRSSTGRADHPGPGYRPADAQSTARRAVGSRPRSPASLDRRRRWAASGRLPPGLAVQFTPGEQAALAVIATEVAKTGRCILYIDHIAAVAGVSRSTAKNAIREARRLGFITVEERRPQNTWKNESNVVQIVSQEWQAWMRLARRGPSPGQASAVKTVPTTHTGSSGSGRMGKTEPSNKLPEVSERRRSHRSP